MKGIFCKEMLTIISFSNGGAGKGCHPLPLFLAYTWTALTSPYFVTGEMNFQSKFAFMNGVSSL